MTKGLIYDDQESLFANMRKIIGYCNGNIAVTEIPREKANGLIVQNHYSHKIYAASYIHLGVFIENGLVGVLQYGCAMNPASCDSVVAGTDADQYLELNRMWLSDDVGRNSESQAIACSIVYIKHRYPRVKWIQSFADERCHCFGIVYQACSFDYFGEHTNVFWELDGVFYHDINMTISPDTQRFRNNVGGQKCYKKTKGGQYGIHLGNSATLNSLTSLGKRNVA